MAAPEPIGLAEAAPGVVDGADPRRVTRESVGFLLDIVGVARNGLHPVDALLISAISQANVAPIGRHADLQLAYAALEAPPPDEMRRPVSMNAVAESLRMPFETVRRRVHGLARSGLCVLGPAGAIVPVSVVTSPQYVTQAMLAYMRLVGFYQTLRGMGALRELPPPTVELDQGLIPVRAVARIATDYVLRVVDLAQREFGDLIDCLLLLETVRANTEHLGPGPEDPALLDATGAVADAHRRPVRVGELARRIGVPSETARRHIASLLDRAWLRRTPKGLIGPGEMILRPRVMRFIAGNGVYLRRLFADLSQLGVLRAWDALPPAPSARA